MDMLRKKELVQSLINITDLNGSGTRVNVTSFLMGGVTGIGPSKRRKMLVLDEKQVIQTLILLGNEYKKDASR